MTQLIFRDMWNENDHSVSQSFLSFAADTRTSPSISYAGPYLPHDGFRPEGVLLPEEPRGSYMSDYALDLAKKVADQVTQVAIHGPVLVEMPEKPGEGTYMSPRTVLRSIVLQRRWLEKLRQPIPSQDFPSQEAA